MRCIKSALLLLHAYAGATTSSSTGTAHSSTDPSVPSQDVESKTPTRSSTSVSHASSVISTPSSSKTVLSTTSGTPLVFLPPATESLCPSRTVNYITHSLPQQCLRTSRSTLGNTTVVEDRIGNSTTAHDSLTGSQVKDKEEGRAKGQATPFTDDVLVDGQALTGDSQEASRTEPSQESSTIALEDEHDSPLDKSKFLSFEEWKKQNLEKAGQSPENVSPGRPQQGNEGRRRPINNALDTLGEEGEIELDFSGFGDSSSRYTPGAAMETTKVADNAAAEESAHASPARHRSKDAGKTCKERFNYASFDCAATVLKTNPKCKSSSSVLVENKDSYMLNECSQDNKFLIVELCDDILVDTVVVANFEFFSSMFRTFRVSVSDRYPVKADRWKDLGTFEARNTRDIQAFLVENPLIWARYLRIEFLTHYGSEFYCPVSLVRVHGTTMMEEFRHQEDVARGEDDEPELIPDVEPVAPVVVETPIEPAPLATSTFEVPSEKAQDSQATTNDQTMPESSTEASTTTSTPTNLTMGPTEAPAMVDNTTTLSSNLDQQNNTSLASNLEATQASITESSVNGGSITTSTTTYPASQNNMSKTSSGTSVASKDKASVPDAESDIPIDISSLPKNQNPNSSGSQEKVSPSHSSNSTAAAAKSGSTKASSGGSTSIGTKTTKTAGTDPIKPQAAPAAQPSTQDSFFKQTNKRLNMLETNSSLNIQYIEEQSRILRDAFVQTEKLQLKKTENFLKHLNDTVMAELKGFRAQYDQLWQSTVIELEESKARSQQEMKAFSSRLTLLADELVWTKRMNVVQSILLLAVLGLFVFASKGKEYMDMPLMQQALKRSQSVLRLGGHGSFDSPSPPGSPESMRANSPDFKRSLRNLGRLSSPGAEDARATSPNTYDVVVHQEITTQPREALSPTTPTGKLPGNPAMHFEPPTPEDSIDGHSIRGRTPSPTLSPEEAAQAIARGAQSGPATPSGTRENRPLEWDGAADEGASADVVVAERKEDSNSLLRDATSRLSSLETNRRPSPLRQSTSDVPEEDGVHEVDSILPSIEEDDIVLTEAHNVIDHDSSPHALYRPGIEAQDRDSMKVMDNATHQHG